MSIYEFALSRRAVKLFNSDMVDKHINRANQRNWIQAVLQLGSKWKFIDHVQKVAL